jgi:DNA polymerase-3 subunit alpha
MVHLHVHSIYSLLDGLASPEALAAAAAERGFKALAITDHGSISGHVRFAKACKEHNIKPILGVEAYMVDDASERTKGESVYHVVILAKNEKGWKSLIRVMNEAHRNFYYRPRVDPSLLATLSDVVIGTACMHGLLNHPNIENLLDVLHSPERDVYLELMPVPLPGQQGTNLKAYELASKTGLPLVVTNDVHYVNEGDSRYHDFLLSLNTGGKLEFDLRGLHLAQNYEMVFKCGDTLDYLPTETWEKALEMTDVIADKIEYYLEKRNIVLPRIGKGESHSVLTDIATESLKRYLEKKKFPTPGQIMQYRDQMVHELDVIAKKAFSDYFLLVYDLVEWARGMGMELSPGRGSSSGSLVCFLLGITQIDPLENDLLFERFLNPERTDYPDIDLDFPQSRRHEALEYLRTRYGEERVANINTFSELKPRSAITDVARYFKVDYWKSKELTKSVESVETEGDWQRLAFKVKDIKNAAQIVDYARGVIGTLRQTGKHAAGIVVSSDEISEYAVLEKRGDDWCVNWEMSDVEYLGWVKLDVLGLRSLDIVAEARRFIKERHGIDIDWNTVDVRSEEVCRAFGEGHTVGTFQFETRAMTDLCKKLHPITSFNTLADINALGRPGPMDSGMMADYVVRYINTLTRGGRISLKPYASYLKGIGDETFGVIIYQEQIMQIARWVAGYDMPAADQMRRVIAKSKGKEEFEKDRERFVRGCEKTSDMPNSIAERLFSDLANFSRYSFNRSHAVAYTELAVRQMWLKLHYPMEYLAALYACTPDEGKRASFLVESHRLGIEITLPEINTSLGGFRIYDEKLLVGLDSIKAVGKAAVDAILEAREQRKFRSLEDFRIRVPKRTVNKKVLGALIAAGCFRNLNVSTYHALGHIDKINDGTQDPAIWEKVYSGEEVYSESERNTLLMTMLPGVFLPEVKPEFGMSCNELELLELANTISKCQKCDLYKAYETPVPFEFSQDPQIMIIGEAPGEQEVDQGRPFVGKAGVYLENSLKAIGLDRSKWFVTNVYKCRPKDNKLPRPLLTECFGYLSQEIALLKPRIILALGNTPLFFFRKQEGGIRLLAEQARAYPESVNGEIVPVVYCIHPAALLREGAANNQKAYDAAMAYLQKIYEETEDGEEEN